MSFGRDQLRGWVKCAWIFYTLYFFALYVGVGRLPIWEEGLMVCICLSEVLPVGGGWGVALRTTTQHLIDSRRAAPLFCRHITTPTCL